jgi:nitroreductase
MDVLKAIKARHSERDFLPDPAPEDLLMRIMEAAIHSPSGGNGQPWEVFIASGSTIEKIRTAHQERARSGTGAPTRPSTLGGPPPAPDFIQQRM